MISEFEFYHGAAIVGMLHGSDEGVSVATFNSPGNASYVINNRAGMYIKHSKKRLSPWRFSFKKEHQDEIKTLKHRLGEVFLVLVCHSDGIVVLNYVELKVLLNDFHEGYEWVNLERNRRQEYAVSGSDGKLKWKIAKNEFPNKIIRFLQV